MYIKNVPIQGLGHQVGNDSIVIEAMGKLTRYDEVRIYYVGDCRKEPAGRCCDTPRPIGIANNVHKDEEGHYVCDCYINMYTEFATHFDGVIDGVSVILEGLEFDVPSNRYTIKVSRSIMTNAKVDWFVINEKEMKEESL